MARASSPAAAIRLYRYGKPCSFAKKDPIIPAVNAKIMQLLIPHSKLHIYHGGHLGLITHAKELVPMIEQFLAI